MIAILIISIVLFIGGSCFFVAAKRIKVSKDTISNELKEQIAVLEQQRQNLVQSNSDFTTVTRNQAATLSRCIEQYSNVLESQYLKCEEEFDKNCASLKQQYSLEVAECEKQIAQCKEELDNLKKQRAAAIEAKRRENLIANESDYYCLKVTPQERNDIQILERVKNQLNNPRILSMLIWSTYFQKQLNSLCAQLLGVNEVCGVYKITNLENGLCYIGQSVNVAQRFKQHCKCGLGIDAPQKNKLYQAMQEYGIWSFSWELLEECSIEKLDEKERFYIELYQSKELGYNSTGGNQ